MALIGVMVKVMFMRVRNHMMVGMSLATCPLRDLGMGHDNSRNDIAEYLNLHIM